MFSSSVHFGRPDFSLFRIPSAANPQSLPPPSSDTFAHTAPAFTIPPRIYESSLALQIPVTISLLYAVTAVYLSRYNREHKQAPWRVSQTRAFPALVVAHNVLLALFSAWTFWGMHTAVGRSFVSPFASGEAAPATGRSHGLAGAVDSLCKLHGPGGFGNAVAYNTTNTRWACSDPTVRLNELGRPDDSDVGRMWNEGLAFYGWMFYMSKLYEGANTFLALAQGKRVSGLQVYQHVGAMLSMWAGIRYMSPPIWMFVYINSAIQTLMYTLQTLTAVAVPVPTTFRRVLSSMQIGHYIISALYAAAHSFISYDLPMQVIIPKDDPSATVQHAAATDLGSMVKKFLFRAAGEEGLAENVNQPHYALDLAAAAIRPGYRWENVRVPCLDTTGETFAVWFNVLYLAPLAWAFISFFTRSYVARCATPRHGYESSEKLSGFDRVALMADTVVKASDDALKGVDREINERITQTTEVQKHQ